MLRDIYCVRPDIPIEPKGRVWSVLTHRAGHETSGHTLAWTLDFLAVYPEWQDAVATEITDLCGDNWPCRSFSRFNVNHKLIMQYTRICQTSH
jgi:cytochrome P450